MATAIRTSSPSSPNNTKPWWRSSATGRAASGPRPSIRLPTPAWGSSGIELVDLDGDGDLDVLVTNGDMLDDFRLKPYHGIRWLENRGGFPFVPHDLANLPGAHRARAVDLDGDGDLDIVACAFVEFKAEGTPISTVAAFPSLVWLEQTSPGTFVRHTLEREGAT
jgi:hypothetical protein